MQQTDKLAVDISKLVSDDYVVYAHTGRKDEDKEKETLAEHTVRCKQYFKLICMQKELDRVIEAFSEILFPEKTEKSRNLFKQMLVNVVVFHDIGKINPEFQRVKMKNARFNGISIESPGGSRHSLLSAALYIDYFLEKITDDLSAMEINMLHTIMLVHAYVISRHHGDLGEFQEFLGEFQEGGRLYLIFEELLAGRFSAIYHGPYYNGRPTLMNLFRRNSKRIKGCLGYGNEEEQKNRKIALYTYARLMFSLLVSSDYYATTEYDSGVEITDFGNIHDIDHMNQIYEKTERLKTIRAFTYPDYEDDYRDINILRNSMFREAEENLHKNKDKNIFFLEAPTGGGKSNIAMNCGFKLLSEKIRKIIYVYPFNTLVEQNIKDLKKIFGDSDIFQSIAVINSITPIKKDKNKQENDEEDQKFYQKALLDRQFLNYPFILTTHVNLFQTMFGNEKEAAISFYQLAGSVIVLDEIQSYKNTLWTEIMLFLESFTKLLGMKVIIMSATLPRLDYLTGQSKEVVNLIHNRNMYFEDKRFRQRVEVSYELLEQKAGLEELLGHVQEHAAEGIKVLVEFIKKTTAEDFYKKMKQSEQEEYEVLCMTGDDNQIDRENILRKIEYCTKRGIILIATQVVEAGVDIDMDVGYKDISKLDSDEQFLGRINRNCRRHGVTYFFDIDEAQRIYQNDYRIEKKFTLQNEEMKQILTMKDFAQYYKWILENLKKGWNDSYGRHGLEQFFQVEVGALDFVKVAERMRLIEDDQWDMSIFLERKIICPDGKELDGREIWERYKHLLMTNDIGYAEKKVKLSEVRSSLNYFIYKIRKDSGINYNDRIGELYCIEDAEKYFIDGRLDKEMLAQNGALFIE